MNPIRNIRNLYPSLDAGARLVLFRQHSRVEADAARIQLNPDVGRMLALCDGTRTLNEVLGVNLEEKREGDEIETMRNMTQLLSLVEKGLVRLDRDPAPATICIDDKSAFNYPMSMHVELTNQCNLKCAYCYREAGVNRDRRRLPTEKLLSILGGLHRRGMVTVEITGGEPLLHPDFFEIIDFCGNVFSTISILTNGMLVDESLLERVAKYKGKVIFSVSYDHWRPEVHDALAGRRGSHAKAAEALRLTARYGFIVRAAMAVSEQTWPDVEQTLISARDLGATLFTYSPIMPFGRAKGKFRFWTADTRLVYEQDKKLGETYPDMLHKLTYSQKAKLQKAGHCGAGHRSYCMDPAGRVRLCATFDSNWGVLGSLAAQTPEEIFGHELTTASAVITAPHYDLCSPCEYTYFCHSCVLRGYTASQWLGKTFCKWRQDTQVEHWCKLVEQQSDN